MDTRLRVGRAIGKSEEQVAQDLMLQLKERGHSEAPPAIATDGKGDYRLALVDTWGQVPPYQGHGRPPTCKQPQREWHSVQVVKERSGNRVTSVHIKVVYGLSREVLALMGGHTAYVERTNLTSRQMNGRLVRKTLSFSKELSALNAACAWEDWVVGLDTFGGYPLPAHSDRPATLEAPDASDGGETDRSHLDHQGAADDGDSSASPQQLRGRLPAYRISVC
jgi:hypothetical protein